MAEVSSTDKRLAGCGLFNAVFRKSTPRQRRSVSASSIPAVSGSTSLPQQPKRLRNSFHGQKLPMPQQTRIAKPKAAPEKKTDYVGISSELDTMIEEHQRSKGGNSNLVRASSGNVMLYGHLGNLKQPQNSSDSSNTNRNSKAQMPSSAMGNVVKKMNNSNVSSNSVLCRALSCRMDPEQLKIMGNEDYKNGRFAEAVTLYGRAIDIDPSKASYRSNKSAALAALGRLLEAVFECREAVRIEPSYHRAHHRLASLYLRLGEAEKALYHFKQAGSEADPDTMARAKEVLGRLKKCDQAKRTRDWDTLIREAQSAISAGADSAPMMFALQADAYMKLNRHQDAEAALGKGPCFDIEQSTRFFGVAGNAALLLIRAQVDAACGRFEDAVTLVQLACDLDPMNREAKPIARRVRAIASARARGNELFQESRFAEASTAYSEGLDHDPCNSVLLCNRAACRSKLGLYEKALEDCNSALKVRPSYKKARLRRADCNSKLGKWAMAIKDYEILMSESDGDETVARAFAEAQAQLKKQRGENLADSTLCSSG